MSVKILAFDLDGTTLVLHKNVSKRNRKALIAAKDSGVILVPATGRMRTFLPMDIMEIGGINYALTSNGASVDSLRDNTTIHSALIPNEISVKVQNILDDYDVYLEYYRDGKAITLLGNPERARSDKEFPESKHHFLTKNYTYIDSFHDFVRESRITPEKINLPYLPESVRGELWERLSKIDGIKLTSSIPDNIEINSEFATKGQALKKLCEHLNIDRECCMAIGDNGNDADMLRFAGISVAMGNSSQEAIDSAKYTTGDCHKDGLAEAIERFIL